MVDKKDMCIQACMKKFEDPDMVIDCSEACIAFAKMFDKWVKGE